MVFTLKFVLLLIVCHNDIIGRKVLPLVVHFVVSKERNVEVKTINISNSRQKIFN